MPNIGTLDTTLNIDFRKAESQYRRFQSTVNRNFGKVNPFTQMAGGARDFEKSIGSATNRVVAFGAAAVVFNTISRSIASFVTSMAEVDKSLTEINVNLNQSSEGLKRFGAELFSVARQTGQTFQDAAKAATELSRQGLTAEETLKRLKDALILSRTTGLSAGDAVETLTAAINSFNKEALTSSEVVNKFAAVDTKFAVSSRDLAEAVSRVGSTAQAAGVGVDELIGLVTSLQQTTARGGATIGNGLKTIFTRVQAAPETISALESVGVAIKDTSGNLRSAIDILRDYGRARERVGEVERQTLDRTVAGTFQINVLKAALADLSKGYSVYDRALQTSANATDEAIRKNEQLNQSLSSLFNSAAVSAKQLVDAIGNQSIGPVLGEILKSIENVRGYLSGETGNKLGESLGKGLLQGLTNILTGPALAGIVVLIAGTLKRIFVTLREEAKTLLQANSAAAARARIQERIVKLVNAATAAERAELGVATSITRQKEVLLGIQARLNRELLLGTKLQNSFLAPGRAGVGFRPSKKLTNEYVGNFADPVKAAISREVAAGVPPSSIYVDKDSRVAGPGNPGGLLVANRRDEPAGGFQGVSRVIAQGGNPKKAGTVPNFALTGRDLPFVPRKTINELNKLLEFAESQTNKGGFQSELSKVTDIALKGKLNPKASDSLFKEIFRLTDERAKLEKQIEISRFKSAKRSKEFIQQEARLADLRAKLQESTQRVLAKQAQRASGLKSYDSPIGPRLAYDKPIGPTMPPGYPQLQAQRKSGLSAYSNPIGPKSPINISIDQIRTGIAAGMKSAFREYTEQADVGATTNPVAAAQVEASRRNGILRATDTRVTSIAGDAPRRAGKTPEQYEAEREASRIKKAQLAERRRNAAFGAAFLLPFAGGFVEPTIKNLGGQTSGGTGGGIASGAIQGAAQGASLGVFGPQGLVLGSLVGALVGALSKSSKSLEEFNEEIDRGVVAQQANVDAITQFVGNRNQLSEGGLRPEAVARLQRQQAETLQKIDPKFRGQLQQQGLTDDKIKEIVEAATEAAARTQQAGDAAKSGVAINEKSFLEKAERFFDSAGFRVAAGIATGGASEVRGLGTISQGVGTLRNLFEDPFGRVSQSRQLGSQLRPLINDDNVKGLDQGVLSRIIGGQAKDNDLARLSMMYQRLGSDIEVTADRSIEFAEALSTAKKQFGEVSKAIKDQKGALTGGLPSKSFVSAPDTEIFRQASLTGRNPRAGRTSRARATFDMFGELDRLGAIDTELISSNTLFKSSKAQTQVGNASDAFTSFLSGAGYRTAGLKDSKGDPRIDSIIRLLTQASRSGASFSGQAKELLPLAERFKATLTNAGVKPPTEFTEGVSGITPGADYGAFNKTSSTAFRKYDAAGRPVLTQNPGHVLPKSSDYASLKEVQDNQLVDAGARNEADIKAWENAFAEAKSAAQATAQALQQTFKVLVTVNGAGSPEKIAQIEEAIQSMFNTQAAMAGRPNPPSVLKPPQRVPITQQAK